MKTTASQPATTKTVLLFQPAELLKNFQPLQLLHIQKTDKGISYEVDLLSRKALQQNFATLPEAALAALQKFQPEYLANQVRETEQKFKTQRAGVALQAFLSQSIQRYLYQQFNQLKPYFSQLRSYHKIIKPESRVPATLPCRFQEVRPQLKFEVRREEDRFSLNALIELNQQSEPLESFLRTAFFLQRDNEYFLLSFKDHQTLDWLQENLWCDKGMDQEAFVEKVLSRIEEDYTVNRHALLSEKELKVTPDCRVLLSELNNAFLLLTPQWLYDGLLVEGPWKEKQEVTIKGERLIISRHQEQEEQFLQLLTSFHPNFSNQRNGYYYLSFAEAQKKQWFIKTYYAMTERNVEVVGMDLLKHFRYSTHKPETSMVTVKEESGLVHLNITIHFGKERVPLATLQKALHAGQRAIVLKDGSLGVLHDEWLEQYATLIKHGIIQEGTLRVSKFIALGNLGEDKHALQTNIKKDWWDKWMLWQSGDAPVFALPATIKATLRPYQQKGFEWLALLAEVGAGACLADDMGLGKTLQTICFLAWYHQQHPDQRHLIVCPTSLLYNWQDELKKFAPSLKVEVYHGAGQQSIDPQTEVLITTYGTLRSQSDFLLGHRFGVAVIDESHNIKNPSAQITRAAQQVEANIRIALSGTPVVNNTFDLYSQLSFAIPGLLGSREFFKREYADPIDRWSEEAKIKGLQKLTAPFILRRTKEQVVTDLPGKTEAVLWCKMSAAQEELYQEVKEQVRSSLFLDIKSNGLNKSKLAVLQGLLKLRQICNHPALLPAEEHNGRLDSTKTELLLTELDNVLGNHKALVFSQFSSMLALLAEQCQRRGISYFLLDGQTPADKRMQMVRTFQEDADAPQLFFISLKAGNTGLNLTAADYVFLFDPWWNTAVEQQAVDRTHRIGQTKNVFSYKLVCKNTIEEKILELQQRKKQLADELISAEEDFVKSLGEEDIDYLFG